MVWVTFKDREGGIPGGDVQVTLIHRKVTRWVQLWIECQSAEKHIITSTSGI
jgi:hypothetical protein